MEKKNIWMTHLSIFFLLHASLYTWQVFIKFEQHDSLFLINLLLPTDQARETKHFNGYVYHDINITDYDGKCCTLFAYCHSCICFLLVLMNTNGQKIRQNPQKKGGKEREKGLFPFLLSPTPPISPVPWPTFFVSPMQWG